MGGSRIIRQQCALRCSLSTCGGGESLELTLSRRRHRCRQAGDEGCGGRRQRKGRRDADEHGGFLHDGSREYFSATYRGAGVGLWCCVRAKWHACTPSEPAAPVCAGSRGRRSAQCARTRRHAAGTRGAARAGAVRTPPRCTLDRAGQSVSATCVRQFNEIFRQLGAHVRHTPA